MLNAFLKTQPRSRICLVSPPSAAAFKLVQSIWEHGHSVFPILPHRARLLTHMIAESRASAIALPTNGLSKDVIETIESASKCLGVPVVRSDNEDIAKEQIVGNLVLEARTPESIVPVTVALAKESVDAQIDSNKIVLQNCLSELMPFSFNWVLDACTVTNPIFLGTQSHPASPKHIIVDPVTVDTLIGAREQGTVVTDILRTVILDWPFSDDSPVHRNEVVNKLKTLGSENILVRYSLPQLGPVSSLVDIESGDDVAAINADIVLHKQGGNHTLCVDHSVHLEYCGRVTGTESMRLEIPLDVGVSQKVPGRKSSRRREMRADWRINKVPIAVYHKKRGFKGQIYYTTKHKGWTLYKSRY